MKKLIILFSFSTISIFSAEAQGLKGLIGKMKDSTSGGSLTSVISAITGSGKDTMSTNTIASGLKEALQVGTERGTSKLSAVDGFFKNAALKILMPAEAQKVESKLRALGLGKQVDNA